MSASLVSITKHQPREQDTVSYWRRRARKAENLLQEMLSSDLTGEHRAGALGVLHGHGGQRLRNAHGLSDCEQEVVDHYRAADAKVRIMLRTLLERLAATTESADEAAR